MPNQSKIEQLITKAKAGDKRAEEEFFTYLSVRFLALITRELRNNPIIANGINLDDKSREICQFAIDDVKKLCPLNSPKFSIIQAGNILRNVLDTFVTNTLVELAKEGNSEAEKRRVSILREKLMERITKKRWGESLYGNENK